MLSYGLLINYNYRETVTQRNLITQFRNYNSLSEESANGHIPVSENIYIVLVITDSKSDNLALLWPVTSNVLYSHIWQCSRAFLVMWSSQLTTHNSQLYSSLTWQLVSISENPRIAIVRFQISGSWGQSQVLKRFRCQFHLSRSKVRHYCRHSDP